MEESERRKYLQTVTGKLVLLTLLPLAILFAGAYIAQGYLENRTYMVFLVFLAGLTGGFVSIQQRLPSIKNDELKMLSESWQSILLIPINGGIFAIVLMLMFLSGLIEGEMFPKFRHVLFFGNDYEELKKKTIEWFQYTIPDSGNSIAKLLFWSFVAGFSERFVPQIIRKTSSRVDQIHDEKKYPQINADEKNSL